MHTADAVLLQARNEIQEPQKLMIFAAVIAVFNLVVAGLFFVFSVFSNRLVKAVFYSGLVLYLVDGVLSFLVGDYVGLGFHGFFLLGLFGASHFITPAIQLKQMADAGRGVLDNQSSWEMPGTADA
ncbi:MAG: hypothetical protein R3C49_00085 [Planctomycetaceae bacterium]